MRLVCAVSYSFEYFSLGDTMNIILTSEKRLVSIFSVFLELIAITSEFKRLNRLTVNPRLRQLFIH